MGKSLYFIACDPALVSGGDNSAIVVCKVMPDGVRDCTLYNLKWRTCGRTSYIIKTINS